ncbi:hypothetical protein ACIBF1_20045 [Spirillospora sp. NPDC050679]
MSGDRTRGPVRRPRLIEKPWVPPGPLRDLKELLYGLYLEAGHPSLDEIHAKAEQLGTENVAGWPGRDSIHRILATPAAPPQQADVVAVAQALAALARWDPADAAQRARELWMRAWQQAVSRRTNGPVGSVRVADARSRSLGVLKAVEVAGAEGDSPSYVRRDVDDAAGGVRARLAEAADEGGFVVLVGRSAVGKTRSLHEAVLDLMPDWWLLQPRSAGDLDALAEEGWDRVLVWLDGLHRFLGGATGLTGGTVRRLLQSGRVVLAGTLSTTHHRQYVGTSMPEGYQAHAVERDLLSLAEVVRVPERLSHAELLRARDLARTDVRIRAALEISDFGLIPAMAAAPQVMGAWQDAEDYERALLTAAVDLVHLGTRSPLPLDLLRDTAPFYCQDRERADADPGWFAGALEYATARQYGAVSLLNPVPAVDGAMGEISGYTVTEYLLQQTEAERAHAAVPAELWEACLEHLSAPSDLTRLGQSAETRREYALAERFYRRAATDDSRAAYRLASLLSTLGRDEEALTTLLPWAETPDTEVAEFAARLLGRTGRAEELRVRAEEGDGAAATELVDLLMPLGGEAELRAYAEAGNKPVAYRLAELLAEKGRTDGAVEVLGPHAASGDWPAAEQLAGHLLAADRADEALDVLREQAARGHYLAGSRLAALLTRLGREDELRARADTGDWPAAVHLAELLAGAGREAELTERADAGDRPAAYRLAHLLRAAGREPELRARAVKGDKAAVYQLSGLLVDTGRDHEAIELLQPHAEGGDESAVSQLIGLLGWDQGE